MSVSCGISALWSPVLLALSHCTWDVKSFVLNKSNYGLYGGLTKQASFSREMYFWWAPQFPEQQIFCQIHVICFRADPGVFWARCLFCKKNSCRGALIKWPFIYLFIQSRHSFTLYSLSFGQIPSHCLPAHEYLSKSMGLNWLTHTGASAHVGTDISLIPYSEVLWSWLRSCTDPLLGK